MIDSRGGVRPAHAQTAAPARAPGTVVVNGARGSAGDPHAIDAAQDRILNGRSASSCAFMDPRRPANDPVTRAYRRDFGLDDPLAPDGEGGAKDAAMAYVSFTLAQQAGHGGAGAALEAFAPTLSPDQRTRADALLHPRVASSK